MCWCEYLVLSATLGGRPDITTYVIQTAKAQQPKQEHSLTRKLVSLGAREHALHSAHLPSGGAWQEQLCTVCTVGLSLGYLKIGAYRAYALNSLTFSHKFWIASPQYCVEKYVVVLIGP